MRSSAGLDQLAYESNQNGNWDIWVTQVSGGRAINLTEDYAGEDRFPSWSPDGSQIAFYSKRDGGGYFVMPALGGEPRKVAAARNRRRDGPPQWSHDGQWVVFLSDRAGGRRRGGGRLWRVPAEGGEAEPVLDEDSWSLIFSPGGDRVYFGARRKGRGNLYEKEFSSSTDRQLTDFAGRPGYPGSLNDTDGEFLYFTWNEDHGDLWVMDVEQGQ